MPAPRRMNTTTTGPTGFPTSLGDRDRGEGPVTRLSAHLAPRLGETTDLASRSGPGYSMTGARPRFLKVRGGSGHAVCQGSGRRCVMRVLVITSLACSLVALAVSPGLLESGSAVAGASRVPGLQSDSGTSHQRAVLQREFARAIGAVEIPWAVRIGQGVVFSSSSRPRPALRRAAPFDPSFASALGPVRWQLLGPGGAVLFESKH
jgi:hypothetical protein